MRRSMLVIALALAASIGHAADIGQIKVAKGSVTIERGGQSIPGRIGDARAGLGCGEDRR